MNERDILGTGIILFIGGLFMLFMETSILTGMGFIILCIGFPTAIVGAIKMYNNANGTEPSQPIMAAEYYIDVPPWLSVPLPASFSMNASDAVFDSPVEDVTALIDVSVYSPGRHIVFIRGQDADGNWGSFSAAFMDISPINDINEFNTQPDDQHPKIFIHPLPVRLNTNIELHVDSPTLISVEIYDLLGKRVRSITNRVFSAGTHNLLWDSRDEFGSLVTTGVYFLRLLANGKVYNHKMMRIK